MSSSADRLIRLRRLAGVDLQDDADPETLLESKNLYAKVLGRVRKRPGCSTHATALYWNDDGSGGSGGSGTGGGAGPDGKREPDPPILDDGQRNDPSDEKELSAAVGSISNRLFAGSGHILINDDDILNPGSLDPTTPVRPPHKCTHLNNFISDNNEIRQDLLVGVLARKIGNTLAEDYPFYVDPEDQRMIVIQHASGILGHNASRWVSHQAHHTSKHGSNNGKLEVWTTNPGSPVFSTEDLNVGPEDDFNVIGLLSDSVGVLNVLIEDKTQTPGTDKGLVKMFPLPVIKGGGDTNRWFVTGVQAIAEYNGVMVLGGYHLRRQLNSDEIAFPHFVRFMDADDINTTSDTATLRVGANANEPVTAMGIVSAMTDTQGFRGQLAIFTSRRMVIYDGIPPTSAADSGSSFSNAVNTDIGTLTPNTVKNTPMGLLFLGSDGMVYIVRPGEQYPIRIGRSIQPRIKELSQDQLDECFAVFDGRFYRLHVPVPEDTGSFTTSEEWWVDLYALGSDQTRSDLGARWYGPMDRDTNSWGPAVLVRSKDAVPTVYAGGSKRPVIFKEEAKTFTDDGNDIPVRLESQDLDQGDKHVEKMFTALEFGARSGNSTTVDATLAATSPRDEVTNGEKFSKTVGAPSPTYGGSGVNFGTPKYGLKGGYRLIELQPPNRVRGRTLKFTLKESSSTELELFELTLRVQPSGRRGS